MVFTAADVQTTGLDARDRIVGLAAVVLRGHGEIPDEYVTVADPGPAGMSRAREIYRPSDEQAADAPKPPPQPPPGRASTRTAAFAPIRTRRSRHGRLPRALPSPCFPFTLWNPAGDGIRHTGI